MLVEMWNLGSLSGKGREVCEELRKRMIDMCCLHEVSWRGRGTRMLRNLKGRMLLEFCLVKELCVSNTWFKIEEKRKVTFRMGENETEIDFVLTKEEHRQYVLNIQAIPGEFLHALVIADIDIENKECSEKGMC